MPANPSDARPLNIVYVFADQMRSTAMGCAGVENVHTPAFDAFAQEGTRFVNAVSNTPVCSPARATLLTGLHTLTHRLVFNDVTLRTDVRCIAHALNAAGYRCGYVGKWHLDCADRGAFIPPGPRRRGFDDFFAVSNCNHHYFAPYLYLNDNPEPIWPGAYEPDAHTALAVDYIRARAAADDPFCLFVSFGPPHCPYRMAPQRFLEMYPPEDIDLPPTALASRPAGAGPDKPTPQEHRLKRELIAGYYAHVTALDECFARLLAAIDSAGIADNTLVVFSSDHGDMLFNQNRGWKCKPWRESIGIPLLMRLPGRIPAARVTDGPISIVDHMPTLLALAGVEIPMGVEGLDLSAFVCGDDAAAPESVYINMPVVPAAYSCPEWRGVVTRDHTYARFRDTPWFLYDDQADPWQQANLADSPDHGGILRQLDELTLQWLARTNDPFEPSRAVADKYYPGHVNMAMPYRENETVLTGRRLRESAQF